MGINVLEAPMYFVEGIPTLRIVSEYIEIT